MSINCFLAMTAAEFSSAAPLPSHIAWMACHFSSYGTGLTNLPASLPPGSMVIVNDRVPVHGHDPQRITEQLTELCQRLELSGFLLDFQQEGCTEAQQIARLLAEALPVPVGVSELYARELDCPVFLAPPPLHKQLSSHLLFWSGREIWLDAAVESGVLHITEAGGTYHALPFTPPDCPVFYAEPLRCHYHARLPGDCVDFTFYRQPEDIAPLLLHAEELGITRAIGLYQQLGSFAPEPPEN